MKIQFKKTGGFAGVRTQLELDTRKLSAEQRAEIESLVRQAGFFDLPADSMSPSADAFQYDISVESAGRHHQVCADDRGAPEKLRPLLDCLVELAKEKAR